MRGQLRHSRSPWLFALGLAIATSACENDGPVLPVQLDGVVYMNARAYTQNATRDEVSALVVRDGVFEYVGELAGAQPYIDAGYQAVDLGGRMVLPGLHDNHIHVMGAAPLNVCDLQGLGVDLGELATTVTDCVPKFAPMADEWLVVSQWAPYYGNEPTAEYPTLRAALDAAAPNNPVALQGTDAHTNAYNSKALALAQDPSGKVVGFNEETLGPGGVFEKYAPYVNLETGVIREDARSAIPAPDYSNVLFVPDTEQARSLYGEILPDIDLMMASRGITSIQDACATDFVRGQLQAMQDRGLLHMHVTEAICFIEEDYAGTTDIDKHIEKAKAVRAALEGNPLIKADVIKIFADGVLEGDPFTDPPFVPNAGMIANYQIPHLHLDEKTGDVTILANSEDSGNNGLVNYDTAKLEDYVSAIDAEGFGVHIHAIGDRTTRVALDALQTARDRNGEMGNPATFAHLQIVHPDDQARLGELGVFLAFTYSWIGAIKDYDLLVTPFVEASKEGQDINAFLYDTQSYSWANTYPVETTRRAGAILVAGSDVPVESRDPRPFLNITRGVTRIADDGLAYNSAQSASLEEILAAYTINGARGVRTDATTGSLEVGKSADFIVLDRNLFDLVAQGRPGDMADTIVELTVFQGNEVYRKPEE